MPLNHDPNPVIKEHLDNLQHPWHQLSIIVLSGKGFHRSPFQPEFYHSGAAAPAPQVYRTKSLQRNRP
jgi:hypothetical protein